MANDSAQCPNPYRPEDCATMNNILQSAAGTRELIEKCKACGFPVEDQAATNDYHIATVSEMKRQFFPHSA